MKKTRKRIFGILMAALMVCLPAMQALAQTYSAGWMDPAPILFPGDVLTDIVTPVTLDGEAVVSGEEVPATWTNDSEDKVYRASTGDDGSVLLTLAGYELDVTGGTSAAADEAAEDAEPVGGHYVPAVDEIVDESAPKTDRAYYPAYTVVKIKADEPEEGMEFDRWTVEQEDVILEDELNSETTVTLPEKKVSITANYRPMQTGEGDMAADGAGGQPGDDAIADPSADGGTTDPVVDGTGEQPGDNVIVDQPQDPGATDPVVDGASEQPGDNVIVDQPLDPGATDPVVDGTGEQPGDNSTADPSADGSTIDPVVDGAEGQPQSDAPAAQETEGNTTTEVPPVQENNGSVFDTMTDGMGDPMFPITTSDEYNSDGSDGSNSNDPLPEDNNNGNDPDVPAPLTGTLLGVVSGTATVDGTELSFPAELEERTLVTVTAEDITSEGYQFAGWEVRQTDEATGTETWIDLAMNTGDDPASASFEMPAANVTVIASYEQIPYYVTLSNTDGTVTAEDGTKAQSASFTAGTIVTVEAVDKTASGFDFSGWSVTSDDGTVTAASVNLKWEDDNPYIATFAMPTTNVTVAADYTPSPFNAVPEPIEESDPSPTPQTETQASAPEPVSAETQTPATDPAPAETQTPATDPAPAETQTPASESIPAETQAPAPEQTPAPVAITVEDGVITAAGTASGAYPAGTVIQLQANAPAAGMKFSKWSAVKADGRTVKKSAFSAVNESVTDFTVPASDVTVTAEYKQVKYKITVNDGAADYEKAAGNTGVTITANEAPEGMEFDYWKVDSGNVSLKDAYSATTTFTMPLAAVEVSAYYRMKEYHVTVQNGYADADSYYMGQQVTIYSNYPASGREFDQWQNVSGNVSFEDASRWKTTFMMPASDVTVSAAYKDGPSPDSNQILDLVAGGEYVTDSTIKFTAAGAGMDNSNPNPGDYRYRPTGYQIGNVTGSWQASPYTTSMSIKARGDYTLKVNYSKDVFDGNNWVADGTTDTRSVTFRVLTPAEAVATGDETPLAMMLILAGASCLLFLLLLSVFVRRKKGN